MRAQLLPLIGLASAILFAGLAVFSSVWLSADGMDVFDGRVRGYDLVDARAYLSALSIEQTGLYQGLFRFLDTIFPALLAVTLCLSFRRAARRGLRLAFLVMTALYLGADYTENAMVGRMLALGPDGINARTVDTASLFTQVKWGAFVICICGLIWLRVRRA